MRKLFPLYLGFRYSCSKKHQMFISFIGIVSMMGIALGVTVLVTVLSVMNGFNEEMEQQVFKMAPHILISNADFTNDRQNEIISEVMDANGVNTYAPYILEYGLLKTATALKPVMVHGVEPKLEDKLSKISEKLISGNLSDLIKGSYKILLSTRVGNDYGLVEGDKVLLMVPSMKVSPIGITPRYKRFIISGFFETSDGLGLDSSYAMVNISDAQLLFQYDTRVSGIRLQTTSLYKAPLIAQTLRLKLPRDYYVTDWTMQYGSHLKAVKLEKTMMLLILSLLIVIAVFNLVSSLVMIVNEKQADIAILRTMGAKSRTILQIFIVQGSFIGLVGTIFGLIGGVLLSYNATAVVDFILQFTDLDGLLTTVYRVDHFPSKIMINDLILVCIVALMFSFVATIYPAYRASKLNPVDTLRYE